MTADAGLAHEVKPAQPSEMVVDQDNVNAPLPEALERLLAIRGPLQLHAWPGRLGQQVPRDQVILPIVLDQQDPAAAVVDHPFRSTVASLGSRTSSNQYRPSVLITSTRPSKVTGLVMKEFTPRS